MKWEFKCTTAALDEWLSHLDQYLIRTIIFLIITVVASLVVIVPLLLIIGIILYILTLLVPFLAPLLNVILGVGGIIIVYIIFIIFTPLIKHYVLRNEENQVESLKKAFAQEVLPSIPYFITLGLLMGLWIGVSVLIGGLLALLLPPLLNLIAIIAWLGIFFLMDLIFTPIIVVAAYYYEDRDVIKNLKKGAEFVSKHFDDALGVSGSILLGGVLFGITLPIAFLIIKLYDEGRCENGD